MIKQFITISLPLALCTAGAAQSFDAYHGYTASQHQAKANSLVRLGFRITSISVHGSTASPRYSAVWRKIGGPAWKAFHGMSVSNYQSYFTAQRALGYSPHIVSANGTASGAVMAGVFTKPTVDVKSWHGLSSSGLGDKVDWARENGYRMSWLSAYGTTMAPRYLVIFRKNPESYHWTYAVGATKAQYIDRNQAHVDGWARPSFVTRSSFGRYATIWRDDKIGLHVPFADLPGLNYQALYNVLTGSGYFPMVVQGSGTGAATRYCGIFVKSTTVEPLTFHSRGVGFPTMKGFDDFMKAQMQAKRVRAGALAIAKDGRLVYARGFTLAESGYPITQPASLFRIASCSKPLTSIAIHQAFQKRQLRPTDKVPQVLGIPSNEIKDGWLHHVTVDHLLQHLGGFDKDKTLDPLFGDSTVANWGGFNYPITKNNIVDFMTQSQFLSSYPGTKYSYSNYGFLLMGMMLDKKNVGTYENVVRKNLFGPLGLIRPRIGGSLLADRTPTEVRYHTDEVVVRNSVMSNSRPLVAYPYGVMNLSNHDANGGWILSAPDYAKVLASFDMGKDNPILNQTWTNHMFTKGTVKTTRVRGWGLATLKDKNGNDVDAYTHSGGFGGTRAYIMRRADGLSFAMFFNGPTPKTLNGKGRGTNLNDIANSITAWPNIDLFPSFGIPGFKRRTVHQVSSFGRSCRGSNGNVSQVSVGLPETDYVAGYRVSGARSYGLTMMHLGISKTSWMSMRLPLPLGQFGALGCSLYVAPAISVPALANGQGIATVNFRLPNDASLIGKRFFTQFACADPFANKLGQSFSNAIETVIGGFK